MSKTVSEIRLRLWRLKIRLLPWTRPKPAPTLLLPPGPAQPVSRPDRLEEAPEQLWRGLLEQYLPPLDGLTVLDLGCGQGQLLRYLAGSTSAARLIGIDREPFWLAADEPLAPEAFGGRLRLLVGEPGRLGLPECSVDVIVCVGYLERLSPEAVKDALAACFDVLRPGGSLVIRTRLCTAGTPSAVHERFASPYSQLLVGDRNLARLLHARHDEQLPYVNWLTATTYVILFHQAGFEALDIQRQPDKDLDPELAALLERAIPEASREELAAGLDAHLVRPYTYEDLARTGIEDTRPLSVRQRAVTS